MKKLLTLLTSVGLTTVSGSMLVSCFPEKESVDNSENETIGDLSSLMKKRTENLDAFNSKISQIDPKIIGQMTFLDIKNRFPVEFDEYINANIDLQKSHVILLIDQNMSVSYNPQNQPIFTSLDDLPKEESEWYVDMTYSEVNVPILMNDKFDNKLFNEKQIDDFIKMSNKVSKLFGDEFIKHEIASYIYMYANDWMIIEQKIDVMVEKYGDKFKENIFSIKDEEPDFIKQYVKYFADLIMLESNTILKSNYFIGGTEIRQLVIEKDEGNIKEQRIVLNNLISQFEEMFINEFKDYINESLLNDMNDNYNSLKELKKELD